MSGWLAGAEAAVVSIIDSRRKKPLRLAVWLTDWRSHSSISALTHNNSRHDMYVRTVLERTEFASFIAGIHHAAVGDVCSKKKAIEVEEDYSNRHTYT